MRIHKCTAAAIVLLLLTRPAFSQGETKAVSDSSVLLPMEHSSSRTVGIIPCRIGGKKFRCLLDSGSEYSMVSSRLKFDFRGGERRTHFTAGSGHNVDMNAIQAEVELGGHKVESWLLRGKVAEFPEFDVILGQSTLRQFSRVTFDFTHSQVLLEWAAK
jgi:hypothetical protein